MLTTQYGLQETHNVYVEEGVAMFLELVDQDKTILIISVLLRFAADTLKPREDEFARVRRAHDTKIFTYCAKNEASFPHPPNGKNYLVNSGYPTRTSYLGPHRRIRYHLDQYVRGGPPTNTRELLNRRHSGLRTVIERTFVVWKAKWRILDSKHPKYGMTKRIKIVTATMALHNFIRDSHRDDSDFVRSLRTEEYHSHGNDDEDDDDGGGASGSGGAGDDDDYDEDGDGGGGGGGHVLYETINDRVMEGIRDTITSEMSRGRRLTY
ncbi:hypothetical protein CARUB_v10018604mg [Capsella rubella]|uniref:DDE Tnp4 domain-containing protein n=1 Tax=Capsella rubella TaxID=81985 RepID=R0HMX0_9BRAS|nr:hypothetical protein CARUB_v10018604mg [Capsella rubella]